MIFQENLKSIKEDIKFTQIILVGFFLVALVGKLFLKISLSLEIFLGISFLFFLYRFFHPWRLKKVKTNQDLLRGYFFQTFLDICVLTLIIFYLGTSEWIGFSLYALTLGSSSLLLPKRELLFLILFTFLVYTGLVFAEYFELIPPHHFLPGLVGVHKHLNYLIIQIFTAAAFFFFLCGNLYVFAQKYRQTREELLEEKEELKKAHEELDEAKKVLEIKIQARTRELRELAESLEEQVKERTKELKQKLEELERFRRLTVGRELKMIQLKQEIEKLREKLKRFNSQSFNEENLKQ